MVAYSFKARFVKPIKAGLGLKVYAEPGDPPCAPKRQTIRAIGKRRHARAGETLQLYTAMRTKQCQKIGEAKCIYVVPITIQVLKSALKFSSYVSDAEAFARYDGFANLADMHAFWIKEHGPGKFEGVLIRWEPQDADGQRTKPRV